MAEHTPEQLRQFAQEHAPKLAEKMTKLCGAVIAKGMAGILEEVCRIQAERDELLAALQLAKNSLVAFKFMPGIDGAWEDHDEANLLAVDAAIAKATGAAS